MRSHVWSDIQVKADPDQLHSVAASAAVYANALARLRASIKDLDGGDMDGVSGKVRRKWLGSLHHAKGT